MRRQRSCLHLVISGGTPLSGAVRAHYTITIMGTLNAFYVRGNGDAVSSAIRKSYPDAKIESGQDFLGVTLADDAFEPPKGELAELSSDLGTDVIWLSFQSVVDAF